MRPTRLGYISGGATVRLEAARRRQERLFEAAVAINARVIVASASGGVMPFAVGARIIGNRRTVWDRKPRTSQASHSFGR